MSFDFPASPALDQEFGPAGAPTYKWNGYAWKAIGSGGGGGGASIVVAATPPPDAAAGTLWWESDSGRLFLRYQDVDSITWVEVPAPNVDTSAFAKKTDLAAYAPVETWGDWTPVLRFGGAGVGMTFSVQKGRWRKQGRFVTLWWELTLSAKGTSTGAATIQGQPYAAAGSPYTGVISGCIGYASGFPAGLSNMACYVGGEIALTFNNPATTGITGMSEANFAATSRLAGTVSFETT